MAKLFANDEITPLKRKATPTSRKRLTVGNKATVKRTVSRAPEVMVKIISQAKNRSAGKSMKNIRATVNYLSRKGEVSIFDADGNEFKGKNEAAIDGLSSWRGIPESAGNKRQALHIIFSMPKSSNITDVTPRKEVTEAVRRLAEKEWFNHQYLYAQHDDTDHAHTHVVLNMNPIEGDRRLNPRKADLQRWRERFAEQLREQGIEANATQRSTRGVIIKPERQSVRHINRRAKENGAPLARVTQLQEKDAIDEANGKRKPQPFKDAILAKRHQVLTEYAVVTKQLLKGDSDDRKLAGEVLRFAQSLPAVRTKHDERVADLLEEKSPGIER